MTASQRFLPAEEPIALLDPQGLALPSQRYDMPKDERMLRAFDGLITARRLNEQAYALVRQGRLAVYPSSHGQEACQVAAAQVLTEDDWLFPTYRDTAAVVARGVDPIEVLTLFKGDWHTGYDPYVHNVAPQATPLSTQLLHGVGVAHAAKMRGEKTVVMALCGDGATSEGDFHEALNFAAVFNVPVVFFIQNNEYAISVPLARQTVAPSLAHKAIGYGMPGERVDGNDIAALLQVLSSAVEQARAGGGPQLVEAHTYRMQAHTNADDETRYRDRGEVEKWESKDPIRRAEAYLRAQGVLDDEVKRTFTEAAEENAAQMRQILNQEGPTDPRLLFEHVYSEPTQQLHEQYDLVLDELEREGAHS